MPTELKKLHGTMERILRHRVSFSTGDLGPTVKTARRHGSPEDHGNGRPGSSRTPGLPSRSILERDGAGHAPEDEVENREGGDGLTAA